MCDCLEKKKEQVIAAAYKKLDIETISKISVVYSGFEMVKKINSQEFIVFPFKIICKEKGTKKKVAYETQIVPTYCPFCGKKLNLK